MHQILAENLAGLDLRSGLVGAEGGNPRRLHGVHHARCQRVVRRDAYKVNTLPPGKVHHGRHVGGLDVHALGQGGNPAVARRGIELVHQGRFHQLGRYGVLPPAAANNQYLHGYPLRNA